MSEAIDKKLEELGIVLPTPAAPIANYVDSCGADGCCSCPDSFVLPTEPLWRRAN